MTSPRRLRHKIALVLGQALLWTITLFVLAWVFENWRGARAWQAYRQEAEAQGKSLDPQLLIPPPAADAENFAAIPLFQPLFDYEWKESKPERLPVWRHPEEKRRLDEIQPFAHAQLHTSWNAGQPADLAEWVKRIPGGKEVLEKTPDLPPGKVMLQLMAAFDPELDAMREALSRPRSRFPLHYEERPYPVQPHVRLLLEFSRIAEARALAFLSLGESEQAMDEALFVLQLSGILREEPFMLSMAVRNVQVACVFPVLWEGLQKHAWNDAQLARMEQALARVDLLSIYAEGLRNDRVLIVGEALGSVKAHPGQARELIFLSGRPPPYLSGYVVPLVPGWIDFNRVFVAQLSDRLSQAVNLPAHRIDFQAIRSLSQECQSVQSNPHKAWMGPSGLGFGFALMAYVFSVGQMDVDLARCAVALERYSLASQALPRSLAELCPTYLPRLPPEIATGGAIRYRARADGTFQLWESGNREPASKFPEDKPRTSDHQWPGGVGSVEER